MHVIVAWLIGGLLQALGTLVGRVLLSLAVGYVSFQGIDAGLGWLKSQVLANINALPAEAVTVMSLLGIGKVISIYSSAWLTVLAIKGLQSGAVKKMVIK